MNEQDNEYSNGNQGKTTVYISGYKLIDDVKPYYVYIVDIYISNQKYTIEKRYSEFYRLHSILKSKFPTPPFPPKKIYSNQTKVLNERQQALEFYLQEMFKINASRNQVLSFLGLNNKKYQSQSQLVKNEFKTDRDNNVPKKIDHIPAFIISPHMHDMCVLGPGKHQVIISGVLKGLYGQYQKKSDDTS